MLSLKKSYNGGNIPENILGNFFAEEPFVWIIL